MKWRWWTACYDSIDTSRGWLRSVKLGPFVFNRSFVDGRYVRSVSLFSRNFYLREIAA